MYQISQSPSSPVSTALATENAILAVPDSPDVSLTPDVPDFVDRCPQHADVPRVPTVGLPHSRSCLVGVAGSVCCDDFHVVSLLRVACCMSPIIACYRHK